MKVYIKSQVSWLFVVGISLGMLVCIIGLDGYRNFLLMGYAFFLIVLLISSYLVVNYYKNRLFYRYLSTGVKTGRSPGYLSKKWQSRNQKEYEQYQKELRKIERNHQNHIKFMTIWVHQMKTPVSVLELMAEAVDAMDMLAETDRLKSGLKSGLKTALTYTRLEAFTEDFIIESISLQALIKQCISEQKRSFIRANVYPQVTTQEDLFVTTDKKWLGILLFQVISNGIKYSAPESVLTIAINTQTQTLTITDSGCGISKEDISRVFRPFFTGDNGHKTAEATGMGLYLVDVIRQQLAITVSIQSTVNQGTSVQLQFENGDKLKSDKFVSFLSNNR